MEGKREGTRVIGAKESGIEIDEKGRPQLLSYTKSASINVPIEHEDFEDIVDSMRKGNGITASINIEGLGLTEVRVYKTQPLKGEKKDDGKQE